MAIKTYVFLTTALFLIHLHFGICEDSIEKSASSSPSLDDEVKNVEKRDNRINYRRLARGLHMLRLGKRAMLDDAPDSPLDNYDQLDHSDELPVDGSTQTLEKRDRRINYRRLARGLHMLRLGKRSMLDEDQDLPLDNLEDLVHTDEIPVDISPEDSDDIEDFLPEEAGSEESIDKRRMSMLRLGKRPMSMLRLGKRPMSMLRLGKRPMSMLRLGKRPMSMLRLGKRPMSMLRLGKRPMSMLRLGKRPMSMLRLGKRPMSMLRLGKRPMSMLRLGKRPMSMLRLGKRGPDEEEDEVIKRPMSMLRLG